ncbi:MAG: efflux RND transporter periplasmic adaptor subunit [Planctomycetota bacterium]|nr:MAG: efflux RND transporter periplasmic adaptor subunit [Planctomycetota bacterium]
MSETRQPQGSEASGVDGESSVEPAAAPERLVAPAEAAGPSPAERKEEKAASVPPTSGLRRTIGLAALGVAAMALLMAWLAGAFREKVAPRERGALPPPPAGVPMHAVREVEVPHVREVTGTIAAEHETVVAAELLGRVAFVDANPGERVEAGHVLARLDPAEYRARLEQAEALLKQAEDHYQRTRKQHAAQTASESQLVQAQTALEAARARVREARTILDKTVIRANAPGVVIERLVEVGDTVTPGRPLVRLYDRLQLVAVVPESLQPFLRVGQAVQVRVDALGPDACEGTVAEIVPEAQALARAFRVKVTGPCPPGLIPGMFGRMSVPLGTRRELRVPLGAVRRVGQVAMVYRALPGGALLRQFVRLGERRGDEVVVRSGLAAGDRVVADVARLQEASRER